MPKDVMLRRGLGVLKMDFHEVIYGAFAFAHSGPRGDPRYCCGHDSSF